MERPENKFRNLIPVIILVIYAAIFLTAHFLYVKKDLAPRLIDNHSFISFKYYDKLVLGVNHRLLMSPYPPVMYLATTAAYRLFGLSHQVRLLSMSLFLVIFIMSMYGIGRELGDQWSGLAVMALAASSPVLLNYSRIYVLEFPQTALTALAFYLLLKTDFFRSRVYSILFGLALALAVLTKWSTGFFMIIPVLWFSLPLLKDWKKSIPGFAVIFLALGVTASGSAWYYRALPPHPDWVMQNWLKYYLLFVPAPMVLASLILLILERIKKAPGTSPETSPPANWLLMALFFAVPAGAWFYRAAWAIRDKYLVEMGLPHVLPQIIQTQLTFLQSMFCLVPIFPMLMVVGLVFLILKRKDKFYSRLLSPVNLILVSLLMLRVSFPDQRYGLSLAIFAAALAGFWVMHCGRAKPYITGIILIISLFPALAWTFINPVPGFCHTVRWGPDPGRIPAVGLLCPNPPDSLPYDISSMVDLMEPDRSGKIEEVLILDDSSFPSKIEFIQCEAFLRGKRIEPRSQWRWEDYTRRYGEGSESAGPLVTPEILDESLAVQIKDRKNSASLQIRQRLSPELVIGIDRYDGSSPLSAGLKERLAWEINGLLTGPVLFDGKIPPDIKLRKETRDLLDGNPQRNNLLRLNRLLLEDAFPGGIMAKFRGDFWNNVCNTRYVIIMSDRGKSIEPIIREVRLLFPKLDFKISEYPVGDRYIFYFLKN